MSVFAHVCVVKERETTTFLPVTGDPSFFAHIFCGFQVKSCGKIVVKPPVGCAFVCVDPLVSLLLSSLAALFSADACRATAWPNLPVQTRLQSVPTHPSIHPSIQAFNHPSICQKWKGESRCSQVVSDTKSQSSNQESSEALAGVIIRTCSVKYGVATKLSGVDSTRQNNSYVWSTRTATWRPSRPPWCWSGNCEWCETPARSFTDVLTMSLWSPWTKRWLLLVLRP